MNRKRRDELVGGIIGSIQAPAPREKEWPEAANRTGSEREGEREGGGKRGTAAK